MRFTIRGATVIAAILLFGSGVSAQKPSSSTAARQQRALDSLTAVVRAMQLRMDSLTARRAVSANTPADSAAAPNAVAAADSATAIEAADSATAIEAVDSAATIPEVSAQPSAAPASGAYVNIGFVSLTDAGWSTERDVASLQRGDHDPHVRGFTLPNTELTFDGAVDPYFKGFANIVYKLNAAGETGVELEEAYALTTSLPANLQLKFGQFVTEFGRQNSQHPHAWSFVDQPLVLNRMFGPDGLRSQGARLSWLVPTPFYTELLVSVLNSAGGSTSSFRADNSSEIHGGVAVDRPVGTLRDMLVVPRIASSFDLSDTQTLLVGASAAVGPNNSGPTARTQIYGVDAYYKWKPATAQAGFPFVSFQSEAMTRRYGAAERALATGDVATLPKETLRDHGAYAQVLYGIKPRIVAGLRGEFANGVDAAFAAPLRADRYRISPNFTWYPTEFSKVRLQYNYDDRKGIGSDHSLWVQFEFLLGAHAAHKF